MRFQLDRRAHLTLAGAGLVAVLLGLNSWFDHWRPSPAFNQVTGYALLALGLGMWALPVRRASLGGPQPGYRIWHEIGGLTLLGGLMVHAANLRSTLLVLLTCLLLLLATLGVLHPTLAVRRSERYMRFWWTTHVLLGCLASALALLHVWAMLAY